MYNNHTSNHSNNHDSSASFRRRRRARRQRARALNEKITCERKLAFGILVMAAIALFLIFSGSGYDKRDSLTQRHGSVCWEEVILRTDPGESLIGEGGIIRQMEEGEPVVLTGRTFTFEGDSLHPIRVEVKTYGSSGWLPLDAVELD